MIRLDTSRTVTDSRVKEEGRELVDKVGIIGLGYVGFANSLYLASQGCRVFGFDKSSDVVEQLNLGDPQIQEEKAAEQLKSALREGNLTFHVLDDLSTTRLDVVLVCVGTPITESGAADLTAVREVASSIANSSSLDMLVMLRSTVPPGTTRSTFAKPIRAAAKGASHACRIAYCPERIAEGGSFDAVGLASMFNSSPTVVGGIDGRSLSEAMGFWRAMNVPTLAVSSLEVGELAKLIDNLWIDVNIALANETAPLCEAIGVDSGEVILAANSLVKGSSTVNVLKPGPGVGGSCLTKDPFMLDYFAQQEELTLLLPKVCRRVNDDASLRVARLAESELTRQGKRLLGARIAVLGLAFKGRTADTRASPARPIIDYLHSRGAQLQLHDAWVRRQTQEYMGMRLEICVLDTLLNADCVLILADHPEYSALSLAEIESKVVPGCIIIDGHRCLVPAIERASSLTYRAIGLGSGVGTD